MDSGTEYLRLDAVQSVDLFGYPTRRTENASGFARSSSVQPVQNLCARDPQKALPASCRLGCEGTLRGRRVLADVIREHTRWIGQVQDIWPSGDTCVEPSLEIEGQNWRLRVRRAQVVTHPGSEGGQLEDWMPPWAKLRDYDWPGELVRKINRVPETQNAMCEAALIEEA